MFWARQKLTHVGKVCRGSERLASARFSFLRPNVKQFYHKLSKQSGKLDKITAHRLDSVLAYTWLEESCRFFKTRRPGAGRGEWFSNSFRSSWSQWYPHLVTGGSEGPLVGGGTPSLASGTRVGGRRSGRLGAHLHNSGLAFSPGVAAGRLDYHAVISQHHPKTTGVGKTPFRGSPGELAQSSM